MQLVLCKNHAQEFLINKIKLNKRINESFLGLVLLFKLVNQMYYFLFMFGYYLSHLIRTTNLAYENIAVAFINSFLNHCLVVLAIFIAQYFLANFYVL